MGIQTRADRQQPAERRSRQRRVAETDYAGPERRKHERRDAVDFSIID